MNQITDIQPADSAQASTALVVLPASSISTIVAADENDILGKLAAKFAAFKADVSTKRGREEIASMAASVASSKMDLIRLGKSLTEGWRKSTAAVNAECKVIEERMDALKAQVRAPLTAFEDAEKARIAGHEKALAEIAEPPGYGAAESAADLAERLEFLRAYPARDWKEFAQRAADILASEIDRTEVLHQAAVKREAEQAELARLRAEAEERVRQDAIRQQAEREARIAAEAAEAARIAAERRAAEEARAAAAKAEAERQAVERARLEAEAQAARAEAQARQAEVDRLAAAEKAKADAAALAARVEAERVAAAERAERERIAAVEAERRRAAEVAAAAQAKLDREAAEAKRAADAAAAADAARAADRKHRGEVNSKALAAIVALGISEADAKTVVLAIVAGSIPAVSIRY